MPSSGIPICIASAISFGTMGIFGKLAYDGGSSVTTLLATRFGLAALLVWALALGTSGLRRLRGVPRRDLAIALALGALAYGAQAGCYFVALERLDASLLSLLVYTFPAIVAVAAILVGRERASRRSTVALLLASAGLALVLAGAGTGALDPLGTLLGLTAACIYAAYVLSSEGVARRLGPLMLSALVCSGAAVTLTLAGLVTGSLNPSEVSADGYASLAGIAVVSTVAALGLFFAGLELVGPTTASILSTAEPVTAVVLAFLVFGESLALAQLAGGALVLAGVLVLTTKEVS